MKKLTRWVLAALAVAAVSVAPRASAQNLLNNGGFDAGTTLGWSSVDVNPTNATYGDAGFNGGNWAAFGASVPLGTIAAHDGAFSGANFFDGGLVQVVNVTAGQAYDFKGFTELSLTSHAIAPNDVVSPIGWGSYVQLDWINASGQHLNAAGGVIAAPAVLGLGYAHIFDLDVKNLARNQWNAFDTVNVAPTGAVGAIIKIGTYANAGITPANPTQFDSLSFAAVPEPGTYAMLAIGIGMMIPVIRRRIKA